MSRFFELTLLADQSLVQAGWVEVDALPPAERAAAVKTLSAGPSGRAPIAAASSAELHWSFEPQRGVSTLRVGGRLAVLSVLLGGAQAAAEAELLAQWLSGLRGLLPLRKMNGDDPEAFEVIAKLRDRPLLASVLLPEGSREECKAMLDAQRALAAALFTARWEP